MSLNSLVFFIFKSIILLMKNIFLFLILFPPFLTFAQETKEITVLVYISARNNLALETLKDLDEMEKAGSDERINVIAEINRIKGEPVFNPFSSVQETLPKENDWTGARRIFVKKDLEIGKINSDILSHEENIDGGDAKRLSDFIKWGKKNFPAKKYFLIAGGHGSGWRGVKPSDKGIAYDEVSKNHISPKELGDALRNAGGVDVYAADACLMQTIEVLYELRGAAKYAVGSQESVPGEGFDYFLLLKELSKSRAESRAMADAAVNSYVQSHFENNRRSITFSIIDLDFSEEALIKIDYLAKSILSDQSDIKLYSENRFSLRNFEDEDARDLYQTALMYAKNSKNYKTQQAAKDLLVFLAQKFIVRNEAKGYKSADAWGVSIYFPFYYLNYSQKYENLTFSKLSSWDEMIKSSVFASK